MFVNSGLRTQEEPAPSRELGERSLERRRRVHKRRQHLHVVVTLIPPRHSRPTQNVRDVRDILRRVDNVQLILRFNRRRRQRERRQRG